MTADNKRATTQRDKITNITASFCGKMDAKTGE
jgi:hypothetical protein